MCPSCCISMCEGNFVRFMHKKLTCLGLGKNCGIRLGFGKKRNVLRFRKWLTFTLQSVWELRSPEWKSCVSADGFKYRFKLAKGLVRRQRAVNKHQFLMSWEQEWSGMSVRLNKFVLSQLYVVLAMHTSKGKDKCCDHQLSPGHLFWTLFAIKSLWGVETTALSLSVWSSMFPEYLFVWSINNQHQY